MQVILQKDVKNLGQTGQTVNVKKGYARHFLFPKKWAVPLTKARACELTHREKWIEAKKKKALSLRQTLLEKLQNTQISFAQPADSSGKLFGSVNANHIVKELEKQGFDISKKWIQMDRPIKQTGEHKIPIQLNNEKKSAVNLTIQIEPILRSPATPEKETKKTEEETVRLEETKAEAEKK